MAIPQKKPHITVEEYLALERAAEYRSEYFSGKMFAMAGGTPEHSLISANLIRELGNALKGHRCAAYDKDLRIEISDTGLFTYPDASVICGPLDRSSRGNDMATNPTVLLEVLSDSTEAYDRGSKFAHYRTIPSFREYVLISQKEPLVEVFFRLPDGTWQLRPVSGCDSVAQLQSLNVVLRLAEIYDRIEFSAQLPHKTIAS